MTQYAYRHPNSTDVGRLTILGKTPVCMARWDGFLNSRSSPELYLPRNGPDDHEVSVRDGVEAKMQALNTSVSKMVIVGCALAVTVLMAGCAMTFGYRHADWLIRWQVDHYLDLSAGQRQDVAARLETILRRHRTEALPQYERFLKEVQERVARGLTNEDLDWVYASYDRFRGDVFERLAPDGGVVLTSVTDKQIRHFEDILQKEEHKAARVLQKPAVARLEERAKTTLSWAEEWLGPLSHQQRDRIRQWSLALPDTQPTWWQYRRQRQQELTTLMRRRPPAVEATQVLHAIFVTPEQSAPRVYLDTVKELRVGLTVLVLGVDRTLTPTQRRKAIATLQKLIDDVHGLYAS